ncbi:MAG: FAD-dependent oxidoreductase [Alphaproteobacteria bacterium]|nr:FAD-dependent oxidoreductase [Alphaproteobacteria bacterium]
MGKRHDTVVVGAGIAGLVAATRLADAGLSVVVLEARKRIGGRILGFRHGRRAVQLGGRWTGPGQGRIKALAAELGVGLSHSPAFESSSGSMAGELELVAAVRRIDELADRVPLEAPWQAPDAGTWDHQTLATWLEREVAGDRARTLAGILMGFLPEPGECSLLHAFTYLKSNGGLASIMGLDGPAHDSELFVGGAHALTDRLGERLVDAVRLDSPVLRILHGPDGVTAFTDDGAVSARRAIVTMPPVLAGRLVFDPPMPSRRDYLTQRMPIRGKVAFAALYDEPFWRDTPGVSSISTRNVLAWDEGGDDDPACFSGLCSIARSRELAAMPPDERSDAVLGDLADSLGPRALDVVGYHAVDWAAEPWSRGCNSFLATGSWTAYGGALRPAVGSIHWAGAEYAERFMGQMEGAVGTAEDVARAILEA